MSGTIRVYGTIAGLPAGSNVIDANFTSTALGGSVYEIELANGDNTITVPAIAQATGVVIQLPSSNTFAVKLKGAGGDTGFSIGKTGCIMLTWDTAAPTLILNSAGAQTGKITTLSFF